MAFSIRFSNGWQMAKTSLKILNAHKEFIVFPILSGVSMLLVIGSFAGFLFNAWGWGFDAEQHGSGIVYLGIFFFYMINYFVIVFFNMGLMHCVKLYLDDAPVSIGAGLKFSVSRIHTIFVWAVFAASVGTLLRIIQDNLGWLGKIMISLVGIVWSVATYFVIPILAYENMGPADAVKRSAAIMKERWGEGVGANFSLGLIAVFFMLLVMVLGAVVSAFVNEQAGIVIFAIGILFTIIVSSTLNSIFIIALYNYINGNSNEHFDHETIDNLFVQK